MDSRLRRSPPDRASAVPYGQAGENATRFPHLAHRSAAAHKLNSTPQQDRMNLISGSGETSSRLQIFSLFLPGSCPNYRDRRTSFSRPLAIIAEVEVREEAISRGSRSLLSEITPNHLERGTFVSSGSPDAFIVGTRDISDEGKLDTTPPR